MSPYTELKACQQCGKETVDLRPYGRCCQYICYECGMENKEAAHETMLKLLAQRDGEDDYT